MIKEIEQEIEIGELFNLLNIKDSGEYKAPKSLQVDTPFGWKNVKGLLKTQENPEWEIKTKEGSSACFTDYHKIETQIGKTDINNNFKWSFIKDLKKGDEVKTKFCWEEIDKIYFNGKYSKMYDLQVEDVECYYTNNFNSHNTMILGNFALNMYLQGKNVLVYTFETSIERLMMRYFSNLTGMSKVEILNSEKTLKDRFENLKEIVSPGNLILKEYNSNEISSNDLMAHVVDLEMYNGFKPDIIIADYLLIMKTNDGSLSSDNSYKYYKTVTEELRNIGKSLYIPIITACQINREGMGDKGGSKAFVTAKTVSESRGIYDTVDVFWTVAQTTNDYKNNKFYLYFDKNRNDKTGSKIEFKVNYEHMKIEEESIING